MPCRSTATRLDESSDDDQTQPPQRPTISPELRAWVERLKPLFAQEERLTRELTEVQQQIDKVFFSFGR